MPFLVCDRVTFGRPFQSSLYLVLQEVALGDRRLQRAQKDHILPMLVFGKFALHVLFDGNHAGTRTILEFGNRFVNTGLVRHDVTSSFYSKTVAVDGWLVSAGGGGWSRNDDTNALG